MRSHLLTQRGSVLAIACCGMGHEVCTRFTVPAPTASE
jgi:hypothetical protein